MFIDMKKFSAAANTAPETAYEFFKAMTVFEQARRQANRHGVDMSDALLVAANKAFGRLRAVEKAAGIATVGYLSDENMVDALDEVLSWAEENASSM